ncbi:MAG TPA: carboxypeptidase-like regulatory domain-containing protein [Kofleriaceae bacterium]|jgi:protocatechuate 3,4-dioxygenase beta subunit|nr:carboxypeptidase-like regulatory domain-containing protein [Kofleriaceae bacterium]
MRRVLAVLGLVGLVAYHYCGGGGGSAKSAAETTPAAATRSAVHGDPNRVELVMLRSAMARLHKVDILAGDLRLEGQAVDDKQQPIGGATITLDGVRTTVTEQDGSFAFDGLAKGTYELAGERDRLYGEDSITLDDTNDPLILTLRYGPTLTVHVVDHAGTPQVGAKIEPRQHNAQLTDADGKAVFRGMDLGDDRVDVSKRDFASQQLRIDVGDDIARTVDKKVVLQPSAPIGGLVLDQDGKPVVNARVTAQTSTPDWSDQVDTDASGHWKLDGFGAGKLTLTAWSDLDVSRSEPPITLDGTTPRMDLVVHVERGATLGGVVTDAAGKPLPQVHISAGANSTETDDHGRFLIAGIDPGALSVDASTPKLGAPTQAITMPRGGHLELEFVMVESTIGGTVTNGHGEPVAAVTVIATGTTTSATQTDEFGHFDFGGIPPGDYTLNATREHESTAVAPEVAAHTGQHRVVLVVPDEATVTGRVVMNGAPVDYFGTIAAPSTTETVHGFPDPVYANDGRFTISGLRPGAFTIVIVGPTFQRFELANIAVTAGATIDVGDVEVTPGRKLRGRVVDSSGEPVADANVVAEQGAHVDTEVSLHNSVYGAQTAHSDATGHFEIAGLPDQLEAYWIQVNTESGVAVPRQLVPADFDREVELVVTQTGSIVVTIVNIKPGDQFLGRAIGSGGQSYTDVTSDGLITIDRLAPGDYTLMLDSDMLVPPIAVHVAANQATQVSFTRPDSFITLDVAIEGERCWGVSIMAADDDRTRNFSECTDPHHALVEHVTPGRFKVCNTACTVVDVAASPQRQSVTIVGHAGSDEIIELPATGPASDDSSPTPSQPDPTPSQAPAPEADPPAEADEAASTVD